MGRTTGYHKGRPRRDEEIGRRYPIVMTVRCLACSQLNQVKTSEWLYQPQPPTCACGSELLAGKAKLE